MEALKTGDHPPASVRASMTARRWEVVSAIAALFATRGFHDVSMRDIAHSLGINAGTLYHHFDSKDHALLAVCLIGHERTLADLVAVLNATGDFAERVTRLLQLHVKSLDELGNFLQVYIAHREDAPPEMAEPLRLGWATYRTRLRQLLEDAVRSGDVSPAVDLRHASWVFIAIFRILNDLHRRGRLAELESFASTGSRIFLHGMLQTGAGDPRGR
jgi:AcrR family transcriptional regulator